MLNRGTKLRLGLCNDSWTLISLSHLHNNIFLRLALCNFNPTSAQKKKTGVCRRRLVQATPASVGSTSDPGTQAPEDSIFSGAQPAVGTPTPLWASEQLGPPRQVIVILAA